MSDSRAVTEVQFYQDDDDKPWAVIFRNAKDDRVADTAALFPTVGAALDWAVKWANDRGLVLPVNAMSLPVVSIRAIPKERAAR